MTRTERVILTLGHARETADTTHLTICGEEIATLSDDLMRISLMAYIPHQLIVGCIVNIVQSNR